MSKTYKQLKWLEGRLPKRIEKWLLKGANRGRQREQGGKEWRREWTKLRKNRRFWKSYNEHKDKAVARMVEG